MKRKFKERRRHSRLILNLPMHIQWVSEEGDILHKNYSSLNVSTGGVYYRGNERIPLETIAIITFDLPTNKLAALRVLKGRGKVIRIENIDSNEKGIAVQFVGNLGFSTLYNNN